MLLFHKKMGGGERVVLEGVGKVILTISTRLTKLLRFRPLSSWNYCAPPGGTPEGHSVLALVPF